MFINIIWFNYALYVKILRYVKKLDSSFFWRADMTHHMLPDKTICYQILIPINIWTGFFSSVEMHFSVLSVPKAALASTFPPQKGYFNPIINVNMKIKYALSTSRIPPNRESIRTHCNTKRPNGSWRSIHQIVSCFKICSNTLSRRSRRTSHSGFNKPQSKQWPFVRGNK